MLEEEGDKVRQVIEPCFNFSVTGNSQMHEIEEIVRKQVVEPQHSH